MEIIEEPRENIKSPSDLSAHQDTEMVTDQRNPEELENPLNPEDQAQIRTEKVEKSSSSNHSSRSNSHDKKLPPRNRTRRRSRERPRDRYYRRSDDYYREHRDRYRSRRDRYYHDESCSDSSCSYKKSKRRSERSRHDPRRNPRKEKYAEDARRTNYDDLKNRKNDRKYESKDKGKVKAKGRGLKHEIGLRSWDEKYVKNKKSEEIEKNFKVNEDWISHSLKEIERGMNNKYKSSPRWSHDKFEKINREDSEDSERGVRMSPPVKAD